MEQLILNLHGIGTPKRSIPLGESRYWVTRSSFVTVLDHIAGSGTKRPFQVLITFDDGNASDLDIALPELLKRGLHAAFFVCAGRIGKPGYLDRIALADLLGAGMEIGTHGMDHRDWSSIDGPSLETELAGARRRIEEACGKTIMKASIPFGLYDRRLLKRLRRESFQCVYTSDRGLARSESWLKPRNSVDCTWTERDMEQVLTGVWPFSARVRRRAAVIFKRLR